MVAMIGKSRLSEDDLEGLADALATDLVINVFTGLRTPQMMETALQRARQAVRETFGWLSEGWTDERIMETVEQNTVELMALETQVATETAISVNRRLYRLAIQRTKPLAVPVR